MATRSQAIPSNWLKADPTMTVEGKKSIVLTIAGVEDGESAFNKGPRRELSFEETHKKMGLNATNWDAIAEITGQPDDDHWAGHRIELYVEKVRSPQGGTVPGLRVRAPSSSAASSAPSQPSPAADGPTPGKKFPANQVDAIRKRLDEYNADVQMLRDGLVNWCDVPAMAVASEYLTDWDQSLTENIRKVLEELKRCKDGESEPAWKSSDSPF